MPRLPLPPSSFTPIELDPSIPIWERHPAEPLVWFNRFRGYCELGAMRSLDKIYNQWRRESGKEPRIINGRTASSVSWRAASVRYHWVKRSKAWDDERTRQRDEEWIRRREQQRSSEWDFATMLMEKAREMLGFPLAVDEVDEETGTITRVPARWSMRDVSTYLETASKLARLAADMDTSRGTVTFRHVEAEARRLAEANGLDPDELVRIAEEIASGRATDVPSPPSNTRTAGG